VAVYDGHMALLEAVPVAVTGAVPLEAPDEVLEAQSFHCSSVQEVLLDGSALLVDAALVEAAVVVAPELDAIEDDDAQSAHVWEPDAPDWEPVAPVWEPTAPVWELEAPVWEAGTVTTALDGLYGQLVTSGAQEVMVTSVVTTLV